MGYGWFQQFIAPDDTPRQCFCTGPQNGAPACPCKLRSGFFTLPMAQGCTHPQHNPPTHLYIPPGQGYRHVCPGCGYSTLLASPQVWCGTPGTAL